MNFTEFLTLAKKVECLNLSTLAEEVGNLMVLYPETCMRVVDKVLALVEIPEDIRWDFFSAALNEGFDLDMAVVIATSPFCVKLLGHHYEVKDDADKGFYLAVLNGLNIDDKFKEYFDFEAYWNDSECDTITTSYGVYVVDTRAITRWIKELVAC